MQAIHFQTNSSELHFKSLPPLSLYIHFPWCIRKCPYCDFNSHEKKGDFDESAYIAALLQEVEFHLPRIWGRPIVSIFMGGGTPSLFSAAAMNDLLNGLRLRLTLLPNLEITLEANPGAVEIEQFVGYRAAGINRLSVGIQSFNDTHLKALGRVHGGQEARHALGIATQYFDRVNADIMYALPHQTLDEALLDIETAVDLGVSHVSAYHLTLEPNTLFAAQVPQGLPDDDASADMQEAIEKRLAARGFEHYETSAFARLPAQGQDSEYSRHNVNYWQFGDYLGIGAGAHSKITAHDGITRLMSHKQPTAYLQASRAGRSPTQTETKVGRNTLPAEFMMNALRLTNGIDLTLFYERTGGSWVDIQAGVEQGVAKGLLEFDAQTPSILRPTLRGQRFLNDVLTLFL